MAAKNRMISFPRWVFALAWMASLLAPGIVGAAPRNDKTETDVYQHTLILMQQVQAMRNAQGVETPWPEIPPQSGKSPGHLLQKSIEILEKINRLRKIDHLGAIFIPPYPSRPIAANEIFEMVTRLVDEMNLLPQSVFTPGRVRNVPLPQPTETHPAGEMLSNVIYQNLWAISRALDPLLGVHGFTPAEVFAQSQRILAIIGFLRMTQNLPPQVKKPPRPTGKHPNHSLGAAYELLQKIARAEKNLWMVPPSVPQVPRKVITPTEVYDALQGVIAELQRIKYRLGVERYFPTPEPEPGKTPDDVIQNLVWATESMPLFPLTTPLQQQDPASLVKTADDGYAVTRHILGEVELFREMLGIHAKPPPSPRIHGIQPKHIYQEILDILNKVDRLRRMKGLGPLAKPHAPLRHITEGDIHGVAVRLDSELDIIYKHNDLQGVYDYILTDSVVNFTGKGPDDIYPNVVRISQSLDTILGTQSHPQEDLYRYAAEIMADVQQIAVHLGHGHETVMPPLREGLGMTDVMQQLDKTHAALNQMQTRAGVHDIDIPSLERSSPLTLMDLHAALMLLAGEADALKIFFQISASPPALQEADVMDFSATLQLLRRTEIILLDILTTEHLQDEVER